MAEHIRRPSSRGGSARALLALAVALSAAGCAAGGVPYVAPPAGAPAAQPVTVEAYRLNVGDAVRVDVLFHPELTSEQTVRPDGRITATGFGDVPAAGRTTAEVDSSITTLLATQFATPQVSVTVQRTPPLEVYVLGEVRLPGPQKFIPGMHTLDVLGASGGISEWGQLHALLLVKRSGPGGKPIAYRLNGNTALRSGGQKDNPPLDPYDIVYVPRSMLAQASIKLTELLNATTAPMNIYLRGWDVYRGGRVQVLPDQSR